MHFTKIVCTLAATILPLCEAHNGSSAPAGSALALIEAQPDLTLVAGLIKKTPGFVEFYSTIKDVTIFVAPDDKFGDTDPNSVLYSNEEFIAAILKDIVVEGVYAAKDITTTPKYANTKLTNPRFVDTERGAAVAKLVEVDGKKTVKVGGNTTASVTEAVSSNSCTPIPSRTYPPTSSHNFRTSK